MFNKLLFDKNLVNACLAAVLALGLAACGSSSNQSSAPAPTEPAPTEPAPPPTANVMIPDQMYLDADNMPMAGTIRIMAGGTSTSGGVVFSCPADGMACDVTVAADGSVTSTGGAATAALTDAAMMQVAQAKKAAEDEADRAALENRDRIIGKDRALEAAANLPATGTAGALDEDEIIITRGGSGPASVTSTGYSASDGTVLPNGGWAGSRLMQAVAGVGVNHLVVYTDKEPATRIQFYNWDGDATTPALYASTAADALTAPADSSTTIDPLALAGGATGNFSAATADPTRFPAAARSRGGQSPAGLPQQ